MPVTKTKTRPGPAAPVRSSATTPSKSASATTGTSSAGADVHSTVIKCAVCTQGVVDSKNQARFNMIVAKASIIGTVLVSFLTINV